MAPTVFSQALRINPLLVIFALLIGGRCTASRARSSRCRSPPCCARPWSTSAATSCSSRGGRPGRRARRGRDRCGDAAAPPPRAARCPECGAAPPAGAAFCPSCGAELDEADAARGGGRALADGRAARGYAGRHAFPATRMRRLRRSRPAPGPGARDRAVGRAPGPPLFVVDGAARPQADRLAARRRPPLGRRRPSRRRATLAALGIPAVLLFGLPAAKDEHGSGAWDDEGVVQLATRAIKAAHPELLVITDVCLCEYTVARPLRRRCAPTACVDNDATLELLARTAVSQAEAGADAVAPSDMMDGRVGHLRAALDDHGLAETPIIAYSAKYASAFYGPFREAADSAPAVGDRRGYQMDPANAREAVREAELDAEEGADVADGQAGAALPRRDPPRQRGHRTARSPRTTSAASTPWSRRPPPPGLLDERAAVLEALTGIRRAGADIVITYHAKDVATWLA